MFSLDYKLASNQRHNMFGGGPENRTLVVIQGASPYRSPLLPPIRKHTILARQKGIALYVFSMFSNWHRVMESNHRSELRRIVYSPLYERDIFGTRTRDRT